jgi:hypothetical protein
MYLLVARLVLGSGSPVFSMFCVLCETRRMREAGSLCEDAAWISLEDNGPGEAPMFEKIGCGWLLRAFLVFS